MSQVQATIARGKSPMSDNALLKVQRVIQDFEDCWNRHDMARFADLFTPDAQFVNVVGTWWRGRDEIKAAHEGAHASVFKHSRLRILETDIRFPAEGIALARSRWRLEGHVAPGDGSPLPPRHGLLLTVLRRQAGNWLVIDTQNTDILEGAVSRPQ
jgi:uncharacterized protein (TIGR02246 family)